MNIKIESDDIMKEWYKLDKPINGMVEIPSRIEAIEDKRIWAYQNGYTAIGYHNFIWYAYNN